MDSILIATAAIAALPNALDRVRATRGGHPREIIDAAASLAMDSAEALAREFERRGYRIEVPE